MVLLLLLVVVLLLLVMRCLAALVRGLRGHVMRRAPLPRNVVGVRHRDSKIRRPALQRRQ